MTKQEQRKFNVKYTKFEQVLPLQGYAKATLSCYLRAVRRLASYCDQCPDQRLTKSDFEAFFSQLHESHSWSMTCMDALILQAQDAQEHVPLNVIATALCAIGNSFWG